MCQLWGCGGAGRNCGALCLYRWRDWGGIKKIRIRSSKFQIENQMPKCRKRSIFYMADPEKEKQNLTIEEIEDLNTFGLFFETMCIRDLRVFADALKGKVYYFRDKTGLECDAVVHLRNGSYWCRRLCIQKTGKIKSIR